MGFENRLEKFLAKQSTEGERHHRHHHHLVHVSPKREASGSRKRPSLSLFRDQHSSFASEERVRERERENPVNDAVERLSSVAAPRLHLLLLRHQSQVESAPGASSDARVSHGVASSTRIDLGAAWCRSSLIVFPPDVNPPRAGGRSLTMRSKRFPMKSLACFVLRMLLPLIQRELSRAAIPIVWVL